MTLWVVFLVLELQLSDIWREIQSFKDPDLMQLVEALPGTVLKARASTTTRKYAAAYQRWKKWVEEEHSGRSFPVNVALFALYLQHVRESSKSHFAVSAGGSECNLLGAAASRGGSGVSEPANQIYQRGFSEGIGKA